MSQLDEDLQKLDDVAASLVAAYGRLGCFAMVVRPFRGGEIRCIAPQVGAEVMSEFLRSTAEALFDGPARIKNARTGEWLG